MAGVNLYGELVRAQLETATVNPSAGLIARVLFNTVTNKALLDNGTLVRSFLINDAYLVVGNSGTAASNVRINRSAAAQLQFLIGSDATAEGSVQSTQASWGALLAKVGGCLVDASLVYQQISTPSNPASNQNLLYFKSDDALYIKNSAGTETKVSGVGQTLSYTAKTTTYTILTTDDVIAASASGGAFTLTLPSAATAGTKAYRIKKTDSTFNAVTIARAGSDTIAGGTSTTLNTQGEAIYFISDGVSAWTILNRDTDTPWTSFTPAWSAVSVNPAIGNGSLVANWRRRGDSLECTYLITMGSTSTYGTGDWIFGYPSGLQVNTTKLQGSSSNNTMIGFGGVVQSAYHSLVTVYDAVTQFRASADNASGRVSASSPEAWGNGQTLMITAIVPITGWNANA